MPRFRATYRLQLGPALGFAEARSLVPYLRDLGVSHLYLSPCLQARSGSTHGYDVVDPTRISDALGGEAAFRELAAAGLGVVLDIVPNHMAASEENPYWADHELRARFFDVDTRTGFHRRFFDIGDLAGVRVEDPAVFETTHALALALVGEGVVEGLRVDHPDGLADPAGYLERLRRAGAEHVWVEKILEPGEELREWPVEGTTGYEFLNDAQALFVDPAGEEPLTELYAEITGERRTFAEIAFAAKLEQAVGTFEPELRELHQELDVPNLPLALASFRVYRTYIEPWNGVVHDADREAIANASLSDRLERILLLEERGHDAFVTRFQQTTGPVMAKGVEDTAFYRYHRLVALNEVGGDPGRFGLSVEEFHAAAVRRAERFPHQLLTTQTHDTKRSGDVRARIGALSTIPDEWREHVLCWRALNAPLREEGAPDANEEYLLYQTLVGAWPIEPERLERYLEKALREAKVNTAWVNGDERWEGAVQRFARRVLAQRPFLDDFEPFAERVAREGERSALGQLLLKLASPGVPDVYQGDELEALSLVDPDNRRPVDWERRRRLLAEVRAGAAPTRETAKLALTVRALDLRARRPQPFEGAYRPLDGGQGVCAFLREGDVLVVVPVRSWEAACVELPPTAAGRWRDVVTGVEHELSGRTPVAALVAGFPVALLERVSLTRSRGHTARVREGGWTPEAWDEGDAAAPPARLPRVDDLPVAERGYEREAVQQAFETFYRHAAQLDATLRVLESMELFARQAGELRSDIRALRAASWGPLPAARPVWTHERGRSYARAGGGMSEAAPRLAVEAAFIVLVAVGAAVADLHVAAIVVLVVASWLIVGAAEFVASSRRATVRPGLLRERAAPAGEPGRAAGAEATMIEAPPTAAEGEAAGDVAEPVLAEAEADDVEPEREAEAELEVEAAAAEPASAPEEPAEEVRAEEPRRRRWFRRRPSEPEPAFQFESAVQSRHVRVLPAEEAGEPDNVVDSWEVAPQLPEVPEQPAAVGAATMESRPEQTVRAVGEDTMESPPAATAEPQPEPERALHVAAESEPQPEPEAEPAREAEPPEHRGLAPEQQPEAAREPEGDAEPEPEPDLVEVAPTPEPAPEPVAAAVGEDTVESLGEPEPEQPARAVGEDTMESPAAPEPDGRASAELFAPPSPAAEPRALRRWFGLRSAPESEPEPADSEWQAERYDSWESEPQHRVVDTGSDLQAESPPPVEAVAAEQEPEPLPLTELTARSERSRVRSRRRRR